jgi:hypothetical protein
MILLKLPMSIKKSFPMLSFPHVCRTWPTTLTETFFVFASHRIFEDCFRFLV